MGPPDSSNGAVGGCGWQAPHSPLTLALPFVLGGGSTSWEEFLKVKCWPLGGWPRSFLLGLGLAAQTQKSLALGFLTKPWGPGDPHWLQPGSLSVICKTETAIQSCLQGCGKRQSELAVRLPPRVCSWFPLLETLFDEQMPRRPWSQASPLWTLCGQEP